MDILTQLNDNNNFIVGKIYAITLNIGDEHIPVTVRVLPTRETLNGVTCQHFQRVKVSDPSYVGHIWSWSKELASSRLPEMLPELAVGDEF